jgi:SAM-dependent methyltransferase
VSRWKQYAEKNRLAWNEIAPVRSLRYRESLNPPQFFKDGRSILDPRVAQAVDDVRGKSLLHLMCATGEETLSWAVLGADATGVDISDEQISLAKVKARDAGLRVRFETADIGSLPEEFAHHDFDLVYTATGVLVWIPNIAHWAQVIAAALKPGGRFVIWEEHPVAMCMWGVDGEPRIIDDYFRRGEPEESRGWDHFEGGETATQSKFEFGWTIGDVVTGLADAGLRIEQLHEFPSEARWRFGEALETAQRLPGKFLLTARSTHAG